MGTKELFAPWRATLPGLKTSSRSGMNWKCWNNPGILLLLQHNTTRAHTPDPQSREIFSVFHSRVSLLPDL
jgi:hypothetical protein